MIENSYTLLPFPYNELLRLKEFFPLDRSLLLERQLEDATGLSGVIAAATGNPEADTNDIRYATRVLSELLHATLELWRVIDGEDTEAPSAAGPEAPQGQGDTTPGFVSQRRSEA